MLLSIATVEGMSVKADAFITTNRTISFEAVPSGGFVSSLSLETASSPKGVAALPNPKRFAVIFIDIAFIAGEPFLSFGKRSLKRGERA